MAARRKPLLAVPIMRVFATLLWRGPVSNKAIGSRICCVAASACAAHRQRKELVYHATAQRSGLLGGRVAPHGHPNIFRLDGRIAFVSAARGHLGARWRGRWPRPARMSSSMAATTPRWKVSKPNCAAEGFSVERAAFDVADAHRRCAPSSAACTRLDILVNNAGLHAAEVLRRAGAAGFRRTYASSVTAAFEIVRAALPALKRRRGGGRRCQRHQYRLHVWPGGARRAPLCEPATGRAPSITVPPRRRCIQLTRHLAAELGPESIRVNALVPGPFPAGRHDAAGLAGAARRAHHAGPHRRGGGDRGPACCSWPAPPRAIVTGTALTVDGGWTAW